MQFLEQGKQELLLSTGGGLEANVGLHLKQISSKQLEKQGVQVKGETLVGKNFGLQVLSQAI
jgi:hypothetical protein